MIEKRTMDQIRRDVSEVILLESLNAQRIDKLNDVMTSLGSTMRDTISQLTLGIHTQAQALSGFRDLYTREIEFIHQALDDLKGSLEEVKATLNRDKDKIIAVEKDIAVARGSIKGAVMTWSGFVALIAFACDKAIEILGRK